MARYINECNLILRNLSEELRSRCPTDDQYCCFLHCCFVNRVHKELWETWYFWFGVALIGLLIFTSAVSFMAGVFSRKRVHNQALVAHVAPVMVPVTAITGPDGLIQPHVVGGLPAEVAARYKTQGPQGTAIFCRDSQDSAGSSPVPEPDQDDAAPVAGPLQPAYPPIQPVSWPAETAREAAARRSTVPCMEMVLPPGYVDPQPSHKQASSSHSRGEQE